MLTYRGEEYITCEELIGFLFEYLSKEIPPERELEFERHLSICPSCVAYLKTYRETLKLGDQVLREDAALEPPEELGAELVRAILATRPGAR
jgi:anti-sigma factor RsiW